MCVCNSCYVSKMILSPTLMAKMRFSKVVLPEDQMLLRRTPVLPQTLALSRYYYIHWWQCSGNLLHALKLESTERM